MKIDRRLDSVLRKRRKLAEELSDICYQVDRFLLDNGIEPDSACWLTGCEIYVNPAIAEEEVRRAILEKET